MNSTTIKAKNLGLDHIGKILTLTDRDESITGRITSIHHFRDDAGNSLARTEIILSALGTQATMTFLDGADVTFDD